MDSRTPALSATVMMIMFHVTRQQKKIRLEFQFMFLCITIKKAQQAHRVVEPLKSFVLDLLAVTWQSQIIEMLHALLHVIVNQFEKYLQAPS